MTVDEAVEGPEVVLVEDERNLRELYQDVLGARGLRVVPLDSVSAAEAYLSRHAPDLLLLDVKLGDGDGLALLDRLEDLLDTPLDPGDLPEQAVQWETQVNDLAAEDSDISAYISALEERRDENQPEPQGDAIAAEIQRYLRRRNQGPSQR